MYRPLPLPSVSNLTRRWSQMQRRIKATFERAVGAGRMTNGEGTALLAGEVVKQSTTQARTLLRATNADTPLGVVGFGCAAGARTTVAAHGEQTVLLLGAETPTVGAPIWPSATPGRATSLSAPVPCIGWIVDVSNYATSQTVQAVMSCPHCPSTPVIPE